MSNKIVAQIVGILVNEGLSAKEVISTLRKSEEMYLERSFHVNNKAPSKSVATRDEGKTKGLAIDLTNYDIQLRQAKNE